MQGVLYFLGRFAAAVGLSIVSYFVIVYLANFILPLFAGTSNSWRIGNAVSGFIVFLPPVPIFICCFADQFEIKERVGAAFQGIIHAIWTTVAFLAVENLILVDIFKLFKFGDARFPEQITYMLAITMLMFVVGFLTLRKLPYSNRSFRLFSAPASLQIFGILLLLVVICQIIIPLISRAEVMESLMAFDTSVKKMFGNMASKLPAQSDLPMLYSSYGMHAGFILLILLTIGIYRSSAAMILFLLATTLVCWQAFENFSANLSALSSGTIFAMAAGCLLQFLAAVIIVTPSARRWFREKKIVTATQETTA